MKAVLLLLALLRPAGAVETRAVGGGEGPVAIPALAGQPAIASLHPLIVGDLSAPENPSARYLEVRARELTAIASPGELPADEAARRLRPLAAPYASPADRFSAGVIAGLLTNPAAAEGLFLRNPALRESLLGRLPRLLAPMGYRSSPATSDVGRMAKDALMDPAVAAAFDGAPERPALEIDDLFFGFWGLHHGAQYLMKLGGNDAGKLYAHPTIPGAAVQVPGTPFDRLTILGSPPHEAADRDEETAKRLGALGLGPRYFGRGVVAGRFGKFYPLSVRERVYGASVSKLVRNYEYGPGDEALVQGLYDRAFTRRLQVPALQDPWNIWIGQTLADPRRRAYLVRADSVYADLDTPEAKLREEYDRWRNRFLYWVDYLKARNQELFSPVRGLK